MGDDWYYALRTERCGPFQLAVLESLLRAGEITRETLVWNSGLDEWRPLGELPEFQKLLEAPAPHVARAGTGPPPLPLSASGPQVLPWVRWWARQVDTLIAGGVFGLWCASLGFSVEDKYRIAVGMVALIGWIPLEALLLSTWGYTPGKWLMRVSVQTKDCLKLRFDQALRRAFQVWLVGIGTGFPIVTLITEWIQYSKLTENGSTTYDRDGGFLVSHETVGAVRIALTLIFWTAAAIAIVARHR